MLFEGAQGTLLDVDHGTYPFVTSSNATVGGAMTGSGVGPTHIDSVIGVVKAYTTRVGEGPFPTQFPPALLKEIQERGEEFGACQLALIHAEVEVSRCGIRHEPDGPPARGDALFGDRGTLGVVGREISPVETRSRKVPGSLRVRRVPRVFFAQVKVGAMHAVRKLAGGYLGEGGEGCVSGDGVTEVENESSKHQDPNSKKAPSSKLQASGQTSSCW